MNELNIRLALDGGEPIVKSGYTMHARWPRVSNADIEAVMDVIRTGEFTEMSGRQRVHRIEADFALYFGTHYALTTNSGTAALHCAIAALGIGVGDEVIVPALGYIACAAAVIHQQAIPIFADVDSRTYNLSRHTVEPCITPRTKAIMVVHLHGLPADLADLQSLASEKGIYIIEDFSQAVGASYKGQRVGAIGDVGAASLMAGKNLPSAGEAGILITNNRNFRNQAATLKCFGEAVATDGSYLPLDTTFGYNYRANVISLVFAVTQLFRLDEYNELRRASAKQLDEVLEEIPGFSPPRASGDGRHVYHMYRFRFDPAAASLSISADQAREALKRIFMAEGLPLVEFQNHPLFNHALLRGEVGCRKACPWVSTQENSLDQFERYAGTFDAIRHSLVLGLPARAPLTNPELVEHYIRAFRKIHRKFAAFERIARELPSVAPWEQQARLF